MQERFFRCPIDCLPGVGDVFSGQYSLPPGVILKGIPKVLDIGANSGAFSIWARMYWEGCYITSYEPQPDIFEYLRVNLHGIPNVTAVNAAIGDPTIKQMRRGAHNRLCSSIHDIGEQSKETIEIEVLHPSQLPVADIVKIDAEGSETYIVENLTYVPKVLILEWHGSDNRYRVENAVAGKMKLIASRPIGTATGIYVFVAV